jgi:hypothetical protein
MTMHRLTIRLTIMLIALGVAGPVLAKSNSPAAQPAKSATASVTASPLAPRPVLIVTTQHATWGRVSFVLRGNPAPELRHVAEGVELHFAAGTRVEMAPSSRLRETGPIDVREENGASVAHVHVVCHCAPEDQTEDGILRVDLHAGSAAKQDAAPKSSDAEEMNKLRETLTAKLAKLNGTSPVPVQSLPAQSPAAPPPTSPSSGDQGPADQATAVQRLEVQAPAAQALAAQSPLAQSPLAQTPAVQSAMAKQPARAPVQAPPRPPTLISDAAASSVVRAAGDASAQAPPVTPAFCLPAVDASDWRGPNTFNVRLVELRTQVASSQAAAIDVAALAEFYLANGLGHEAMAAAVEALQSDATPDERVRLTRDADIARLMIGDQLSLDSPLLALPADCARTDAPLWRALAAAAARDAEGAARNPEIAAASLRAMPEPLQRELAFRIVAAVSDNLDALQAMAGAMRNATTELPEDEARRFLLQARIAGLTGDQTDYATFLTRAARFDMTVPGVIAKARLAAIKAAEAGPSAAHYEVVLADIARTYRHEGLGQKAAEQYAELHLRRHDYAQALAIADESAGPHGAQTRESRGAGMTVRILRMLLVDPQTPASPEPAERIALFLRYGGYTTPGDKGDDIRLAAGRLMLDRHMPYPALDTLRQLSATSAGTTDATFLRATAEAYAGDPGQALELVRALPDDIAAHRIKAEALDRMEKPVQAAHALDGVTTIADRVRRAGLFFEGDAWKEAAGAYADLLRDSTLPDAMRDDLAKRYALAVAMSGEPANVNLSKLPDGPAQMLAAMPPASAGATGGSPSLTILRGALDRARHIETLLDPAPEHRGS